MKDKSFLKVKCKFTGEFNYIKRIRAKSKAIEFVDGTIISAIEFKRNWDVIFKS